MKQSISEVVLWKHNEIWRDIDRAPRRIHLSSASLQSSFLGEFDRGLVQFETVSGYWFLT